MYVTEVLPVKIELDISALRNDLDAEVASLPLPIVTMDSEASLDTKLEKAAIVAQESEQPERRQMRHTYRGPSPERPDRHNGEARGKSSERRKLRSKSAKKKRMQHANKVDERHAHSVPPRGNRDRCGSRAKFGEVAAEVVTFEVDFCSAGDHLFNEYIAPRSVECNNCNRKSVPGEAFWGCSKCQFDECMICHVTRVGSDKIDVSKPQTHLQREMSQTSQTSQKVCKYCQEPFKGFGDTCPDCRLAGPQNRIRHCAKCGTSWRGWDACATCN